MAETGTQKTKRRDAALSMLATHPASELEFFVTASRALSSALDYRWAGVALLEDDGKVGRVLALVERDRSLDGFAFPLPGSPCGALYAGAPANGYAYFCATVAESFPGFDLFGKSVARTYLGACFRDEAGQPVGHVFVVDEVSHNDDAEARTFLALVAQRVGTEWERSQSESRLRAMFNGCRDGILISSDSGALVDINPAALDMLQWERRWIMRHGLPAELQCALTSAVPAADGSTQGTLRYRRGDGVEKMVEFSGAGLQFNGQSCRQYYLRDVTERNAQEDLRRHYEAIMEHSKDFLALVNREYRYLAVSRRYAENFGTDTAGIVGHSAREVHGKQVFDNAIRPMLDRCLGGEQILWQHPIDGKQGPRMVESNLIPCVDKSGAVVGVVVNARDITESYQLSRRRTHLASHDDLTQLLNRREFEGRLNDALLTAQQHQGVHALCYVDLDQFKLVNDTAGHSAGDEMLRQLSGLLQARLRGTDTLARLGGDEFGVLLHDCSVEQAQRIADELLSLLEGYRFRWENRTFQTTASIGVVPITAAAQNVQQLLASADIACYAAKDMGRNRVHIYDPGDADLQRRHSDLRLAGQIRAAVQAGRFELYHQPVASLRDPGAPVAYDEILVRMVGERGELVQPGTFVGAAERFGLMRHVDQWVIHAVLHNYATLFAGRGTPRVAINLSGTSLADDTFLGFVRRELDASRFDPSQLCFEITETAAINNLSRAREFIGEMRRLGCRFALDDFGSGLSSFSYLRDFPVDYIKIDGVFVRSMEKSRLDRALVDAIGSVARAMGIGAIAEHLETPGAMAALRESGIEYAQGYLIEAPRPLGSVH